jgi:hypothetical protein
MPARGVQPQPVMKCPGSSPAHRRRGSVLALGLLAMLGALALASPAGARVAAIETSASLDDHSEDAVMAAVRQAVVTAVRGAVAMGLPWIRLRDAAVTGDRVTVLVVATDVEPDDDEAESDPGAETRPVRIDL